MKITEVQNSRVSDVKKKQKTGASGGFGDLVNVGEAAPTTTSSPVAGASSIAYMDAVLAAQQVDERDAMVKAQVRRGHDLLDHLEELRREMLAGEVHPVRVKEMVTLARQNHAQSNNPEVEALLKDIETRAAVELAKLGLL